MRILYDNEIFRIQKYGGVSRYCAELMHGMQGKEGFDLLCKKFFSYNTHLKLLGLTNNNFVRDHLNIPGKKFIEGIIKKREDKFLFKTTQQGNFDIFHPTYYNPAFLKSVPKGKVVIATIHDMTYELYYDKKYKKVHQESLNKKNIIHKATHIVTVSENTKNDLLKVYPELHPPSISVIYHGSSLPKNIADSDIKLPSNYLLFVGKRPRYKNFTWLLTTIAEFLKKNNFNLVCAGGRSFSKEELELIGSLQVKENIKYVDIKNDSDLATIYRRAACYINPSTHEGFGIPILEAFSCGCPTLVVASSCFPEVAGSGALYFQDGNQEELLSQLIRIISDKELVKQLTTNGYKRLEDFSWEKSVNEHAKLYKSLV